MFSSDNDWLQPSMANSTFSCVNQPLYSFALLICISKASKKRSLWGMSFFLFMPDVLNWLRNVPNWMNASLRFVGDIFRDCRWKAKILSLIWYCEFWISFLEIQANVLHLIWDMMIYVFIFFDFLDKGNNRKIINDNSE